MDISPNRRDQRSSILLKGLGGGLTHWDDLKTWQVRQEALLIQTSPSKSQATSGDGQSSGSSGQNVHTSTFGANLISLLMQTRNFPVEDRSNGTENAEQEDGQSKERRLVPTNTNGPHHDLSIIPEVDEDTRTTLDLTAFSDEEATPTLLRAEKIPKLPLSIPPLKVVPPNKSKPEVQPSNPNTAESRQPPLNSKPYETKNPSLNMKPAENKRPTRPFLRKGQGLVRFNLCREDVFKPYQNGKKNPQRITKPPTKPVRSLPKKQPVDCPIALSSLKLKKEPPKNLQQDVDAQRAKSGFTTWSHLLAQDPEDENLESKQENTVSGLAGVYRMQDNPVRQNLLGSPKRTGTLREGGRVREEDEESLAAYVALEQHVGDTSFCSTSSKVDRLVRKSSRFHLSESPRRQNRLLHTHGEEQKSSNERLDQTPKTSKPETCNYPVDQDGKGDETLLSDWEAEEEEIKQRKMSQFTTGRINVIQVDDESLSESDPESEVESESSEEEDSMFSAIPVNPVKVTDFAPINNPCDTSTASIDLVIENINRKVEEHLSRLCVEIETLQKSNASAKNQVKSLKKQVRKLEQKLATEHLAYERKLAEQREDSGKALAEERAKVAKEKGNFERFCREQKKKEPSPVLVEQVERLRSDMVAKEEKWRAERAKSRGVECNLRIQITNLRQENEKLKAENSKLKREKETAMNAAKAKNVSNTKVINAIAQHLSKAKPQVTVTKETKTALGKSTSQNQPTNKANNTAAQADALTTKKNEIPVMRQPTIGVFPTAATVTSKDDEWLSSDEEIDLGPETPEKLEEVLTKAMSNGSVGGLEDLIPSTGDSLTESVIAKTEERYNALFENKDIWESQPSKKTKADSGNNVIVHPDGSVERKRSNGTSILTLSDGTQKRQGKNGSVMTVPPSGWPILVTYYNGDKLERHEDGTVQYFYAKTQTWQITHPDGREELRLPNGVVGDKKEDGSLTVKIPTETETTNPASIRGVSNEAATRADTIVILPNGEQEIRTKDYVERRFQDGTVRYLYNDGMQKTIYKSGRIRVKDKDGKLLMDTATCERR